MDKNITSSALILSLGMLMFSCSRSDGVKDGHTDLYFPVEKVVQQQVDSLSKTTDLWTKTVNDDDKNEVKKIFAKDLNWKTELAMFFDLTPNKKAYIDKFSIDSTRRENGTFITYTATDIKLTMLTVVKNEDGSLRAIYGDLESDNLFYRSEYQLSLIPYKAFAISGKQTLAFINSEKSFSIQWVKENPDSLQLP